jgi:AcrR family transcriptional regulator
MGVPEGKELQILDAAAKVFARYGFRKTTMGDIVREAGVARATVYKYFRTKEKVFVAVLHKEFGEILAEVRSSIEGGGTARERLRRALLAHLDGVRRKRIVLQVTLDTWADIMSRWTEHMQGMLGETMEIYGGIVREGAENGEIAAENVELTTWTLLLSFKGLFMGVMTGDIEENRTEILDTHLNMIFDGLVPREATT